MKISRTVTVAQPVHKVFAYLSDFTTTTEWDPGTIRTTRAKGDGAIGSEYLNTSSFLGRETQLTYVVEDLIADDRIRLRGTNPTLTAIDTMTFTATTDGHGCEVVYTADFSFHGPTRWLAPLLWPAFKRLGDQAAAGMRTALDGL